MKDGIGGINSGRSVPEPVNDNSQVTANNQQADTRLADALSGQQKGYTDWEKATIYYMRQYNNIPKEVSDQEVLELYNSFKNHVSTKEEMQSSKTTYENRTFFQKIKDEVSYVGYRIKNAFNEEASWHMDREAYWRDANEKAHYWEVTKAVDEIMEQENRHFFHPFIFSD